MTDTPRSKTQMKRIAVQRGDAMPEAAGYNGWTNYDTWNVALWIQNDERYYDVARKCKTYKEFLSKFDPSDMITTPDQVFWKNKTVNYDEIDAMIKDLY